MRPAVSPTARASNAGPTVRASHAAPVRRDPSAKRAPLPASSRASRIAGTEALVLPRAHIAFFHAASRPRVVARSCPITPCRWTAPSTIAARSAARIPTFRTPCCGRTENPRAAPSALLIPSRPADRVSISAARGSPLPHASATGPWSRPACNVARTATPTPSATRTAPSPAVPTAAPILA